jgi:hypothetical protein
VTGVVARQVKTATVEAAIGKRFIVRAPVNLESR